MKATLSPVRRAALPARTAAVITLSSALVFYLLCTHATFNPLYERPEAGFDSHFFVAQANALLHGHLYVDRRDLPNECWIYHGRCYGYFGLTPSLLRLPVLPLLNAARHSLTPVFLALALTIAVGAALAIAARLLAGPRRVSLIAFLGLALALSLGPAGDLVMLARPGVFEEAIAWSVAFALIGVYSFLRWWQTPSARWAAAMVVSLALSANARPTTIALAIVLGVGVAARGWIRFGGRGRGRTLLLGAAVALLPTISCLGVYWLKFHAVVPNPLLQQAVSGPTASPRWLVVRRVDRDSLQGLRFVPTALLAFFRPDSVAMTSTFPFVEFRFGAGMGVKYLGIPQGSMYVQPFSTVPVDMPLVLAFIAGTIALVVMRARSGRISLGRRVAVLAGSPLTYCVVGTAASAFVMLGQGYITNRYVADFFPLLAVAGAVAVSLVAPWAEGLSFRGRRVVVAVVSLLIVWSLLVNLGLDYQSWWHGAS